MKNSKRSLVHTKYFQINKSANLTTACAVTAFHRIKIIKTINEAQLTQNIKNKLASSHRDAKTPSKDPKISPRLLFEIGMAMSTHSIAIKVKILKEMHGSFGKNSKEGSRLSNKGVKILIGKVCLSMNS
jgi:hypothetical protein